MDGADAPLTERVPVAGGGARKPTATSHDRYRPTRGWLTPRTTSSSCARDNSLVVWESSSSADFVDVGKKAKDPECTSLAWSADGSVPYAGAHLPSFFRLITR